MKLTDIIEIFESAPRIGPKKDNPEGSRYIQISETLAEEIKKTLVYLLNSKRGALPSGEVLCLSDKLKKRLSKGLCYLPDYMIDEDGSARPGCWF